MEFFLSKIAFRMPVIQPWSGVHVSILVLTGLLVCAEGLALRKIRYRKPAVLGAVGIVLMLTEILKQIFLSYVRGWSYSFSDFPFQLCSIPMWIMLLYPFLKEEQRAAAEGFLMTFGLIGGMAALLAPAGNFSSYVLLTVHSLLWHILLILVSVFLAADRIRLGQKESLPDAIMSYRKIGRVYLILAAAAVMINACLKDVSQGTANMFFLGPSLPNMFVLDNIYRKWGWIPESLLFAAATWTSGLLVYVILGGITGMIAGRVRE